MVNAMRREALVVLEASADPSVAAAMRRRPGLLQSYGDRLFIVDPAAASLDSIRTLPGVAGVLLDPPAQPLPDLDPGAELFTAAWAARLTQVKARGLGDGLPWDTPGYQPP